ncbi:MAG: hypothetical protein J6332_08890 [Abditibacteriota bacterium]|nr:hypothetical protein [Abditibacteriota bacterium]
MSNPHYNQNYTKKDGSEILKVIKDCVKNDRYIISQNDNRKENELFIENYKLGIDKQTDILLHIKVEDFCHSLRNTNIGYKHETLYVFVPQVSLPKDDIEETVSIYTKFNIIKKRNGDRVIVISFHKANKPADYLFDRPKELKQ